MSAVLSVRYIRIRLLLLLVLGWRLVLWRIFQILTGFFGILFIVFLYLLVVLVCIRFILFYVVGFIFLAVPFCRRISLWCRLLCLNLLTLPRVGRIGLLALAAVIAVRTAMCLIMFFICIPPLKVTIV